MTEQAEAASPSAAQPASTNGPEPAPDERRGDGRQGRQAASGRRAESTGRIRGPLRAAGRGIGKAFMATIRWIYTIARSEKAASRALKVPIWGAVAAVLGGFAFMVSYAVKETIDRGGDAPPLLSPEFMALATALSGLVGGAVTVGLVPVDPQNPTNTSTKTMMGSVLTEVGRVWMLALFAVVFFCAGVTCVIVSVLDDHPAEFVKTEASIAVGLFLPAVAAFMHAPSGPNNGTRSTGSGDR